MGFFSILFRKRKLKRWKGKPLYIRDGVTYWKGMRVCDEEFTCDDNIEEIKAYNRYLRKHGGKIRFKGRKTYWKRGHKRYKKGYRKK